MDFEEFIQGLAIVCRGTKNDKIHFIFNMYDVSHDQTGMKALLKKLMFFFLKKYDLYKFYLWKVLWIF